MFQPPGFCQHALVTSLGTIAYYSPDEPPWEQSDRTETLVFLHGFGGGSSAFEWSRVYPAFASEYQVLAPDLLGWGRSDHPERNYRVEDYLITIREFLEATCTKPVTVIASSLTGAMTLRLATESPQLFRSLILTTPAGLSDFGNDYSRSFFAQLVSTPIVDRVLYSAGIATSSGIRSFLEQRQFADPRRIDEEIVAAYLASAQQPNAEYSALSFVRGDLCFDLALYVPKLETRTAMIWGRKSQFTSPELGERLAALNPGAIEALEIIESVGLTPQLELPGLTIGLIRKFLRQFEGDRGQ